MKSPFSDLLRLVVLVAVVCGLARADDDPRVLAPFRTLETARAGLSCSSIVKLADGSLLTADGNATLRSRDLGKTWGERTAIYSEAGVDGAGLGIPGGVLRMVITRDKVLVLIWRDKRVDDWDKATGVLGPKAQGDVWTIRSLDGGKTWTDRQKIFAGICGHPPISLLQVENGNLVVPVQYYAAHPLRCVIQPYVSTDNGKTWTGRNIIDLGGHGDHDGAFEPCMVELRDGRVWMLIRTNWDRYWEAISTDHGMNWRTIRPSGIEASSSPPYILRLASGKLVLIWNRLYPEGQTSYKRRSDHFSETAGSWHREELSLAVSGDEGATWSKPVIMAHEKDKWLSYPYAFEPEPGRIWIFSGQGKLAVTINEAELAVRH